MMLTSVWKSVEKSDEKLMKNFNKYFLQKTVKIVNA